MRAQDLAGQRSAEGGGHAGSDGGLIHSAAVKRVHAVDDHSPATHTGPVELLSEQDRLLERRTLGGGDEQERATELARNMVGAWGMSDAIGSVTVITEEGQLIAISSKQWRLRCWSARRFEQEEAYAAAGIELSGEARSLIT